ncbi:hypothetical protein M0208_12485 [Sphingomonas sp. SUN019]|uniref:response regulator n=1 Tax=Sphingomonas sp. SUN019 TaxID=2937788 RepID=UPI0021649923|nr:hypothetical protein [Sphingomonas sp. SUN019]UVO51287.1 hypothetical protein M0208_12485 [Sphingomonas sp. SUN019]
MTTPPNTVLYIDADEMNRQVVSDMLAVDGVTVRCVATRRDALALAEQHRPEITLVDYRAGEGDDLRSLIDFRSRLAALHSTKLVVMIALFDDHINTILASLGFGHVLRRPVAMDTLLDTVRLLQPR